MASSSVLVRVPATVGNLAGAGDCAALALEASLNLKVTPRLDGEVGIRYFGQNGERVPRDRANPVVQAIEAALRRKGCEFKGADFEIYSSVPVGVGLGSTTAAVLAGVMAADHLFSLGLEEAALLELAGVHGRRRDNVHAAWSGGLVVCTENGGEPVYRRTSVPEDVRLAIVIPEVVVGESAEPAAPSQAERSIQRERAAALLGALAGPVGASLPALSVPATSGAGLAVPGLGEVLKVRHSSVLSVFVCGAGPAIGILARGSGVEAATGEVRACLARHGVASVASEYRPSSTGARDWNAIRAEVTLPTVAGLRPAVA